MQLTNLHTKFIGRNNFYYDEIDSTQAEIWRLYKKNAPNGTLVMAGIQTNGVGTHGRRWYTTQENNIAFSFLINLDCNIKKINGITFEIAKIVIDIMKDRYNIILSIKEPNDIVYHGKKIGGILTETKIVNENVKALVIGIGINTYQEQFNEELKDIAGSIKTEFNVDVDVKKFIEEFCERFEKEILERIEE